MKFTSGQLVEHWKSLCDKYPIYSIEDGLDEEDWEGWQMMTRELGEKVQLVGDDLLLPIRNGWQRAFLLAAGTLS